MATTSKSPTRHTDKIPPDYIRKQTLKNAERYITPELKEYEEKVLTADDKAKELEYELFLDSARQRASAKPVGCAATADVLAQLDVLASPGRPRPSAQVTVRPTIVEEPVLEIVDGRHPVLDHSRSRRARSSPTTAILRRRRRAPSLLITGPNMAGKSTYIRQVALITLLAQIGSLRPGQRGDDRHRRSHLRPRRRERRARPRAKHVHGRDDRDGAHPQHRDARGAS